MWCDARAVTFDVFGAGAVYGMVPLAGSLLSQAWAAVAGDKTMRNPNAQGWKMKHFSLRSVIFAGVALALAGFSVESAQAQGINLTRIQSQNISNSIGRQIQLVMKPKLQIRNAAGAISTMKIGSDASSLAVVSEDNGIRVWSLEDGRQTRMLPASGAAAAGAFDIGSISLQAPPVKTKSGAQNRSTGQSYSSRVVVIGDGDGKATLYDAVTGKSIRQFLGHQGAVQAVRLSRDGATLATGGVDRTIRLWETASGRQIAVLDAHGDGVTALAFSASGRSLASAGADRTVRLWSLPGGAPLASMEVDAKVGALVFNGDSSLIGGDSDGTVHVWSASGGVLSSWDAESGAVTAIDVNRVGSIITTARDEEAHVWSATGSKQATISDPDNKIGHAFFSSDGNRVITSGSNGLIKVWNASTGAFMAQLILTKTGWAVTDTKGRFDGSEGGLSNVSWAAEQGVFDIANFSEPYYEPGVLAKTLRAPEALLTPAAPAVEDGVGVPPSVALTVAAGTQAPAPGPTTVTVTATDLGGGVDQIKLFHNSKAVDAAKASGDTGPGPTRSVTFAVQLAGGANVFQAVASSREHIEGQPVQVTTQVLAPEAKPALHLLVVGVNQYANPDINLNYAVADAKGFIDWAKKIGKADDYSSVEVITMFDRAATRSAILERFHALEKSRPEDVVVIYLAGHGENEGGSWYFLPTEFGRTMSHSAVAAEGVSSKMFQDGILKMGASRVLLLIDACKSGSLGRAFAADASKKDLQKVSRSAGIHVLVATDKDQLAVELAELGHGAFTYTVLDGMNGAAAKNGIVNAKGVLAFAVENVPLIAYKYTQAEQFPTVFSRGSDFELGHK